MQRRRQRWCRQDEVHTAQQARRIACVCVGKQQKVQCRDVGDFEGKELIPN